MLHAVPNQPAESAAPPLSREEAFRRSVEDAVALPAPDAVARIMQLYVGDTRALHAHIEGLQAEASEAAAQKRQYYAMLTQLQMTASHKLWEGARMAAELSTYRDIVDGVRRAADCSGEGPIAREPIAAALATEPAEPAPRAVTLAFLPSEQFRGAVFVSEHQDVTFVFTFIGWSLIDHGPGAYGIIEPMFLVEDRALCRSTIEYERHVKMENFLPQLAHAA